MLLKTLKEQHRQLRAVLGEVMKLGTATEEACARMREVQRLLLDHLESEDRRLYPALQEAALTDPELAEILDELASGMDDVTQAVARYFESQACADERATSREVGRILALVNMRISREENVLFRRYEQLGRRVADAVATE